MKLFEPGRIGRMEVKNRIVMAPMGLMGMEEVDLSWGERIREFYLTRARGGTGLITTWWGLISQKLEPSFTRRFFDLHSDSHLESLHKIVEGIHRYDAKVAVQLSPGRGRVMPLDLQDPRIAPISASAVPCYFNPERITRALATEEVEELTQAFGTAAKRCKMAGVDAVELHGHSGFLMDQFMTALWNYRVDKYGGSRQKRLTFAREAIAAIKNEAGESFPVIYRISINHYLEGGRTPEESLWIAKQLEVMGVDAIHANAGTIETSWVDHPPTYQMPGCLVDMAEMVKQVVKIPVIAVGKLWYPSLAEKVLQEGKADFIAIGRGLLADPDWANKVMEGREKDIRPCIGDNEGCMGEASSGRGTSCSLNPTCGHEKEYVITPIKKRKTLLIVGGGPASMEAARVAGLRGFDVTLWEKTDRLGGSLWPASTPEFKKDLRNLIDYQITQLKKKPMRIELNKEAMAEDILSFGAEYTILGTGAVPDIPDIPGVNESNMVTAVDLLLKKKKVGERVLIVGGGLIGCETAVYLAQKGHKLTVIELFPDILTDMHHTNRNMLLKMMADNNVQVLTNTRTVQVMADGILVKKDDHDRFLPAESLVLAAGMRSCNELQEALTGKVTRLYAIGDCVEPRRIINAIWDAFHTVREIE